MNVDLYIKTHQEMSPNVIASSHTNNPHPSINPLDIENNETNYAEYLNFKSGEDDLSSCFITVYFVSKLTMGC